MFTTDYRYIDRETKAKYVWLKYRSILRERILDVGADACYLEPHLDAESTYVGIGLGGRPDQRVDLERERIPFADNSFDCVLCLDVLEHLDNIHAAFDELCRVTCGHVIVSLPNPYAQFYHMLRHGDYRPRVPLKFYGLPVAEPADRHKWFFSTEEAEQFVRHRADVNGMRVVQVDVESGGSEGRGWRGSLRRTARRILLHRKTRLENLYAGPLWAVLKKDTYA